MGNHKHKEGTWHRPSLKSNPTDGMPIHGHIASSSKTSDMEARKYVIDIERRKSFIMWTGVSAIMIIILAIWLVNVKAIIDGSGTNRTSQDDKVDLDKMADDFSRSMDDIRNNLEKAKSEIASMKNAEVTASGTVPAASQLPTAEDRIASSTVSKDIFRAASASESTSTSSSIDELKDRLMKIK